MSIFVGKRLRWRTTKETTPMVPKILRGTDENCNRALTLVLWPLGSLDFWWEPRWRTDEDGPCEVCRADARADGCCEWCGGRPCNCDIVYPNRVRS